MVLLDRGEVNYRFTKFSFHEENNGLCKESKFVKVCFFSVKKICSI